MRAVPLSTRAFLHPELRVEVPRRHPEVWHRSLHLLQASRRDTWRGAARDHAWVARWHLDIGESGHDGGEEQQALVGDAPVPQREEAQGGEGEGGEGVEGVTEDGERGERGSVRRNVSDDSRSSLGGSVDGEEFAGGERRGRRSSGTCRERRSSLGRRLGCGASSRGGREGKFHHAWQVEPVLRADERAALKVQLLQGGQGGCHVEGGGESDVGAGLGGVAEEEAGDGGKERGGLRVQGGQEEHNFKVRNFRREGEVKASVGVSEEVGVGGEDERGGSLKERERRG